MKENFPPEELSGLFRLLAISSRLAAFSTLAGYGLLLKLMGWRVVSRITSFLGFATIAAALIIFPSKTQHQTDTLENGEGSNNTTASEPDACAEGGAQEQEAFLVRAKRLLQRPWYKWALLSGAGLTGVTNLTLIISSFFKDTLLGASDLTVLLAGEHQQHFTALYSNAQVLSPQGMLQLPLKPRTYAYSPRLRVPIRSAHVFAGPGVSLQENSVHTPSEDVLVAPAAFVLLHGGASLRRR